MAKGTPFPLLSGWNVGTKSGAQAAILDHDAHHPHVEADRVGFDCYLNLGVLLIPGGWDT